MWTCPEALTAMLSASADTTSGTSQMTTASASPNAK